MTGPPAEDFSFPGWDDALGHLADVVELEERPQLVVLDEFTYLLRNEPAIGSVFQKLWNHRLSRIPRLKLVLTGSLIGMMGRQVFSYQALLCPRSLSPILLSLHCSPIRCYRARLSGSGRGQNRC